MLLDNTTTLTTLSNTGIRKVFKQELLYIQIFRLCRYHPGGHFAPHYDGFYAKNSHERSMKTFMLYLNNEFQDGSTNFVDEKQQLFKVTLNFVID